MATTSSSSSGSPSVAAEPHSPGCDDAVLVLATVLRDGLLALLHTEDAGSLGLASRRLHETFLSPKALRASVQAAGPSDGARFRFWGHALRVRAVQRELLLGQRAGSDVAGAGLEEAADALFRLALFGTAAAAQEGERGPAPVCSGKRMLSTEGQEGEILRDISRTFPLEPLFRESTGVGQNLLASVLKACLAFHADVGYMQGMNYVTAGLLFALRRQLLPPSPFTHGRPRAGRRQHRHEAFSAEYYTTDTLLGASVSSSLSTSSSSNTNMCPRKPSPSLQQPPPPAPHGSGALHSSNHHHQHYPSSPAPTTTTTDEDEDGDGYRSDHSAQSLDVSHGSSNTGGHHHHPLLPTTQQWEGSPRQMAAAEGAFWLMTAAMSSTSGLAMRLLWHPEVPHLKLRTFQFEKLLAMHLPRLHAHFRQIKLAPDILTTQWCNTLLAYCLPLPVLLRVWDVVFLDGWKALFRVCLALLQAVEQDLLPLNLEDSGRFLRQWTARRHPLWREPNRLLRAAREFKVTRGALHELTEEFHLTLLREQLDGGGSTGEWLARYGPGAEREMLKEPELEGLRAAIQGIEGPARSDFSHLRAKIETCAQRWEAAKKRSVELEARLGEVAAQVEELQVAKAAMLVLQQQQQQQDAVDQQQASPTTTLTAAAAEGADGNTTPSDRLPATALRPQPPLPPAPVQSVAITADIAGAMAGGAGLPRVPSLASTLMASIREIRPALPSIKTRVLSQLGVTTPTPTPTSVTIPRILTPTSFHHPNANPNDTTIPTHARARAGTEDSVTSSASAGSSSSSSTRSRRSSLDLAAMGSTLSRLAERLAPPPPPTDAEDEAEGEGGGVVGGVVLGQGKEEEDGGASGSGTAGGVVTTPSSSSSSSARGLALAALTGQTAVAGITGRSTDALVQERRLTKLEAQLASLRVQHAALQLQRSEAAVALEEAEGFRHSLSTQLLHLLQEAEDRVQQRMREAARTHLLPGQHRPTVTTKASD